LFGDKYLFSWTKDIFDVDTPTTVPVILL